MRVPSLVKLCFNYTSQGPLKKWTDHNKFAITENSEAPGPLRGGRKEEVKVPHSFQLLTETRDCLVCLSVIPIRDLLKIDRG